MAGTGFAETTPYGNLECAGQVWEARPDGESTRDKAKFRKGMEAASGQKRTPQHEGVTERREETAENPLPHTMCHTPHWAYAGRVAFYYFVFLKRRKCIRGHFSRCNTFTQNEGRSPKTEVKLRFPGSRCNPFARNEVDRQKLK